MDILVRDIAVRSQSETNCRAASSADSDDAYRFMLMLLCHPFKSTICHQGEDNYTSEFLEAAISFTNMLKCRLAIFLR